ncbi:ArdC family protein [Alicyclobacillus sp. SP_1]|uniref:ArdC family protein n=1 Tax=Alicyclobacillus sp. SP_1 TaxID=2942475 RepID=UPI0021585579|nr:ArdC family protein [Alicyclobacillus sp. SP_1]MCY0870739.1 ArdC family protein [Bacillota bacterium]
MHDKVQEAMSRLEQGLEQLLSEDAWKRYLRCQARFHTYSFQNTLLISLQRPEATRIAGFQTWKTMGRHVRKGEQGIMILAPLLAKTSETTPERSLVGFRTVYVFDVSQTEGKPLPEVSVPRLEGDAAIWPRLRDACPYPITETPDLHGANGCFHGVQQSISLLQSLEEQHKAKTLIHEWAHGLLHAAPDSERVEASEIQELEAESVAFVVSDALGLDTSSYSFGYIAHWAGKDTNEHLKRSGGRIQKAAHRILQSLQPMSSSQAS